MNDYNVMQRATLPKEGATLKKPNYMIVMSEFYSAEESCFLTTDKPDMFEGYLVAKGFFPKLPTKVGKKKVETFENMQEYINKKYLEILTGEIKELICEMYFPWGSVKEIKNLDYKAK